MGEWFFSSLHCRLPLYTGDTPIASWCPGLQVYLFLESYPQLPSPLEKHIRWWDLFNPASLQFWACFCSAGPVTAAVLNRKQFSFRNCGGILTFLPTFECCFCKSKARFFPSGSFWGFSFSPENQQDQHALSTEVWSFHAGLTLCVTVPAPWIVL